jgi:hypothetical protein
LKLRARTSTDGQGGGNRMKKAYASPLLVEYGRIADCTFATPHGQVKGCVTGCHLDKFGERSALSTTGGS